jgi:hypothetical protein
VFERGSAGPCGWGRPLCYLWGCGLSVSRTPGAVQAPSSVGRGKRASGPRPAPAPPCWQVLPATRCRRRPWVLASVGGRRGRAAGVEARRAPRRARPAPPGPSPLAGAVPLCPGARGRGGRAEGAGRALQRQAGWGREGAQGVAGGGPLRLAGAASVPLRWLLPWPHLYVEQRY